MGVNTTPKYLRSHSNSVANTSLNDIKTLIENSKEEVKQAMKTEIDKLSDTVLSLVKRINELNQKNEELERKCQMLQTELKGNTSASFEELEDRNRRKANLIIAGLPEQVTGTAEERKDSDWDEVKAILKHVNEAKSNELVHIHRIGQRVGDKNRLIRVVCKDENVKHSIISNAKSLRNHGSWKNIYINPDKTKIQRREDSLLRAELRRRKENGETVFISRGKIVSKSESSNFH